MSEVPCCSVLNLPGSRIVKGRAASELAIVGCFVVGHSGCVCVYIIVVRVYRFLKCMLWSLRRNCVVGSALCFSSMVVCCGQYR